MVESDSWNASWGGGTQISIPKDRSKIYNQKNNHMEFEEMEVIKEFPFLPNQCIIFIKTYNSWHQASPLRAPSGSPLRKILTINIEENF